MAYISAKKIKKTYGPKLIFDNVSFEINNKDRIALVGRNGTGKSTIFKIITGNENYDSGELYVKKDLKIGYLEQEPDYGDKSVREVINLAKQVESVYDTLDVPDETKEVLDVHDELKQVLTVPGEEFKLVVEYSTDLNSGTEWTITAPKKLTTKTYTQGLDSDTKVYIDNIHTDVSTVSDYTMMNGILQDSMDDRIHNSLMLGFPISDDVSHIGINQIEGQNDTFVSGSVYAFNGDASGSYSERRFEESDYLEKGVYGSLISSSYGLLIQKRDNEPYGVDVDSTIVVYADNEVEIYDVDEGEIVTYRYDRDGSREEVSKVKVKDK